MDLHPHNYRCKCEPCAEYRRQQVRDSRARKAAEDAAWEAWKDEWKSE